MINKYFLAFVLIISLGLSVAAQAEEELVDKRWYVAPFGSYVNPGGDRFSGQSGSSNPGYGAGIGFGKMLDKHFNVELRGFYNGFDQDFKCRFGALCIKNPPSTVGQWDLAGGTVDLQYYFWRDKFSPYTVIAVGGMNSHVNGRSGIGIIGEAGAGFTYEFCEHLLFRSDVRYRYNNNFNAHLTPVGGTDEYHDMLVNVGFVVPIGDKPTAPAPESVADCSTQDADADGVNDCIDQCPGTMVSSKVNAQGCPLILELKGVNFEYDSAQLTPGAMTVLDGVAENLIAYPQKNDIEVRGHTSSEGSNKYNMRLSQKRSQSVADYLSMKGVTNRLTAHGYGEDMPIADNSTEEGRSQNRRVELVWGL
jgi:OmpA-OmpF porin, OOP family